MIQNGPDDETAVGLNVLLDGDVDLCPDSSGSCELVGFLEKG